MAKKFILPPGCSREQTAIELTRFLLHKHYRESNVAADESVFDEPFFWFGAAEPEFSVDRETVLTLFRQFPGKVPKCSMTEEDFHAAMIAPDVCMVAGRFWVTTEPSTDVYIRFHQRISTCVRWRGGTPKLCMLHLSNPYVEMTEDDVGFPAEMAQQSREYLRQQIEAKKRKIAQQAAELTDIYNTVSCGILRLRRTPNGVYHLISFNPTAADLIGRPEADVAAMDWSRGFSAGVSPEHIPQLSLLLDQLLEPGERSSMDYQMLMEDGRTTYVHSSNQLVARDENGVIIQRLLYDVTERVLLEESLKRMSYRDGLTGLFNRALFNETEAELTKHPPRWLGVALFDINGLKRCNDRFGHIAGDRLIRRVADQISAVFSDASYRMGGDEFLILDCERGEAEFRAAVRQVMENLERDHLSVAVGLSWREEGCNILLQMEEVDRRMYEEKAYYYSGR